MGRYIVDFGTSKSPDEIQRRASTYLRTEGFVEGTYRDEQVWKKNKQWFTVDGPQYLVVRASQGSVHLEAWVPFLPGIGEIGTVALFARIPMKRLMKRVAHLEQALA